MSPLASTKVIPDGWEAHHAPVVEGAFDCTITIGPAGGTPAWNEETERTETTVADPVYNGPASIAPITDTARNVAAADDDVALRRYLVTIDRDACGITNDHVIHVTQSPDPMLAGRTLTDLAVARGRRFARLIQATLPD